MRQFQQVGADVHAVLRAPVDAPGAARGEHANARQGRDSHGAGNSGCTVPAQGHGHGQVAGADFLHGLVGGEQMQFVGREAHFQASTQHGDGGGRRSVVPHDLFDFTCHLHVLRVGHPVADDGAFQRDDGAAFSERGGDFGLKVEEVTGLMGLGLSVLGLSVLGLIHEVTSWE